MKSRKFTLIASAAVGALALAACGGGGGFEDEGGDSATSAAEGGETAAEGGSEAEGGDSAAGTVEVLIGSSGDAETEAVQAAVDAWSAESGIPAEVIVASDLGQQLSQGFAGGSPADLFYMSTDQLATFAANGSVMPYAGDLPNADTFYPNLVDAFSIDGEFYCAPKDFSTLALVINDRLWTEAGLTEADYPTTWEELATVSQTLTKDGVVGLSFGAELQRVGVFLAQAGGGLVSEDGTQAIVNSPENVEAMTYLKDNLAAGNFAFAADLGAGWGGEAFGKEMSAMVIEGNWITGAMTNDYPEVGYTVIELPEGPGGLGTIQYTNCWGIATDADNTAGAQQLVEYLTTPEQQMAFAEAFGVMPSVSAAAEDWKAAYPDMAAFIDGAEYAINLPATVGSADVISDFNAQLATIANSDVTTILESVNSSMQAVLDDQG